MTTTQNIPAIQLFLQRFTEKEKHLQRYKIERDRTALSGFLHNFGNFERLAFQFRAQSATYYNVFDVLGLTRYEEKLHTPFLAHLLDPKGEYSQGRLFFNAFFKWVLNKEDGLAGISHIEILPEHHTPYGRIDILIKYRMEGKFRVIVIENKIDASDQPRQLERYHDYLIKTLGLKTGEYFMVYLTPWKKQPSFENKEKPEEVYSIPRAIYNRLCTNNCFLEIGYHAHINPFLKHCLGHIKAPVVAETVKQYLQTIQNL